MKCSFCVCRHRVAWQLLDYRQPLWCLAGVITWPTAQLKSKLILFCWQLWTCWRRCWFLTRMTGSRQCRHSAIPILQRTLIRVTRWAWKIKTYKSPPSVMFCECFVIPSDVPCSFTDLEWTFSVICSCLNSLQPTSEPFDEGDETEDLTIVQLRGKYMYTEPGWQTLSIMTSFTAKHCGSSLSSWLIVDTLLISKLFTPFVPICTQFSLFICYKPISLGTSLVAENSFRL